MKIIILVFLLFIPSYSNAQFESVLKELKSTIKSLDKKEQQKAQKPESNNNQQEIDCESSPEAYQSCLVQTRSDAAKNGLPKELHGNWRSNTKSCNMEAYYEGVYIDAKSFTGFEDPCDIQKVERITSVGHIKLTLKCPNDYTDDTSGFYKRFVTIIISNNKLEVSDDSRDQAANSYKLVRCP